MDTEKQTTLSQQPLKQWVKCSVWCLIYILFIVWVGNYWWLLGLPIVFDLFITNYIPWTWWKNTKNKTLLSVFGWVDAIVFALVAVYFINTFLFQNYQIPSSSLEKSLLVGDFLFVSKASYGPRVPNTPLSFPLVQHTFPLLNCKSFIEHPQWEYHRLKGFDSIKRNDIVVFNFPAGDTVAVKMQNPDYYSICYSKGYDFMRQQNPTAEPSPKLCYSYGREIVRSNNSVYGDIVYRPVDRRENYVKRCVAIAGDWMQVKNNQVFVNGQMQVKIPGIQFNYFVQTDGTILNPDLLDKIGISKEDIQLYNGGQYIQEFASIGLDSKLPIYHFPLNEEAYTKLQKTAGVAKIKIETSDKPGEVFPLGGGKDWTRDNYGPIWVPKKGNKILLNAYNLSIYARIITNYENNKLEVKGGVIYINNQPAKTYQFKMNYYWMMGDNRHNSADSRYWGFVPEDHVVGRPVMVWLSLDKDKSWFDGKIRWNRFFKNAER